MIGDKDLIFLDLVKVVRYGDVGIVKDGDGVEKMMGLKDKLAIGDRWSTAAVAVAVVVVGEIR